MNNVFVAAAISLAAIVPILYINNPVIQAALLWIVMQFAIQISFHFIPNALKVAVIACTVVLIIQLVWYMTGKKGKEGFSSAGANSDEMLVKGGGCGDINATDCWSDPEKKLDRRIEALLQSSSAISREIETYLRVDQPDRGVVI